MSKRLGATEKEWFLFADLLGLGSDLLPAVANTEAQIAPESKLKSLGKTPSFYGRSRCVYGLGNWTDKQSTPEEVDRWSKEPDYSICLIGRRVKAIDCDITEHQLSREVENYIRKYLRSLSINLPVRFRKGSPKFLLAFSCEEETLKRVIKTEHGIIEFLGNRQQFLVAGTHDSGTRYEWRDIDSGIPELSMSEFDKLWAALQENFGIEPEIRERERKSMEVDTEEPILKKLEEKGMVISSNREGGYNIICPFEAEHSSETVESATRYWPAHTGGFAHASIKCLHAHCAHRSTEQFKQGLGFSLADGFEEVIEGFDLAEIISRPKLDPSKFTPVLALPFANDGSQPGYLVKRLIPANSIGYIFGSSGTGKTFITFDIIAAVARGLPWRGLKVRQGAVVYICAEGAHGFRTRIKAYCKENGIEKPEDLPIYIIAAKPNLMDKAEMKLLYSAIEALDIPITAIVLDTYAACMSGDENSSVDVTKVLNNVHILQKGFGTTVLLVHHAGKDNGKGARGWSGLRSAVDFEYQVIKEGEVHALTCTKMKDGMDYESYGFLLREVDLGVDDELDPITSCVIEHTERKPLDKVVKSRSVKASLAEEQVYHVVQELYERNGVWPTREDVLEEMQHSLVPVPEAAKGLNVLVERMALEQDKEGRYCLPK